MNARVVAASLLVLTSFVRAEPPDVKALFPAGVGRGEWAEVKVVGKRGSRPVAVWTSSDALTVTVPDEGETFTVTARDDAPLGLHWLRVHNAEGAGRLRPFLVGSLPEMTEAETNDFVEKANEVDATGTVANGILAKSGDVDAYAVELKRGDRLVAALESNFDLGAPMDAVLQVTDSRGFVLDQNDDTRGYDPRLVFDCPADGRYVVRVFAFPATPNSTIRLAGAEDYVYRLTLTTGPYVDHVVPLALRTGENDVRAIGWNLGEAVERSWPVAPGVESLLTHDLGTADPIPMAVVAHPAHIEKDGPDAVELPASITGHIAAAGEVDEYAFRASKGVAVSLVVEAATLGFPLDAALEVVDGEGKSLKSADDTSREEYDPALVFSPPADGTYRVRVRDVYDRGGLRFAYRLRLEPRRADVALEVAADRFTVMAGKSVKVPVTIDRRDGFAEPVEVVVEGLPAGVTAAVVTSDPKGDTKAKVEIEITATAEATGGGEIRILGRAGADDSAVVRVATAAVEGTRHRTGHLWFNITPGS